MGRPTKFDRAEAVELAMREIWRHGYKATSARGLADKLGITRSSFYNAFGSREQLFREVMVLYADQCPDRVLLTQVPLEGSVVELLVDTFRAVCHARAIDPDGKGCMAVNCFAELASTDDVLGTELRMMALGAIDHIEALLGKAAAAGEIKDSDLRAKALALQNLLIGLQVMAKAVRSEDELWATAKTTLAGLGLYREPPSRARH